MTTILQTSKLGSAFNKPAYKYIRSTDKVPSTDDAYAQDDPMLRIKLFNPTGAGTWYIAGYDPDTGLAYGAALIFELEIGDFDMNEIVALRGPWYGLPVERDLWWTPRRMSEVMK